VRQQDAYTANVEREAVGLQYATPRLLFLRNVSVDTPREQSLQCRRHVDRCVVDVQVLVLGLEILSSSHVLSLC